MAFGVIVGLGVLVGVNVVVAVSVDVLVAVDVGTRVAVLVAVGAANPGTSQDESKRLETISSAIREYKTYIFIAFSPCDEYDGYGIEATESCLCPFKHLFHLMNGIKGNRRKKRVPPPVR